MQMEPEGCQESPGTKVGHLNHFVLNLSSVCDSFVYVCVIPALKTSS